MKIFDLFFGGSKARKEQEERERLAQEEKKRKEFNYQYLYFPLMIAVIGGAIAVAPKMVDKPEKRAETMNPSDSILTELARNQQTFEELIEIQKEKEVETISRFRRTKESIEKIEDLTKPYLINNTALSEAKKLLIEQEKRFTRLSKIQIQALEKNNIVQFHLTNIEIRDVSELKKVGVMLEGFKKTYHSSKKLRKFKIPKIKKLDSLSKIIDMSIIGNPTCDPLIEFIKVNCQITLNKGAGTPEIIIFYEKMLKRIKILK